MSTPTPRQEVWMFDHSRADAVAVNAFQVEGEGQDVWFYTIGEFVNVLQPDQGHKTREACLRAELVREEYRLKGTQRRILELNQKLTAIKREDVRW